MITFNNLVCKLPGFGQWLKNAVIKYNFKIAVVIAILLFIACGVSFLFNEQDLSDTFAFWSFYFLLAAGILLVINRVIEMIRERK